MTISFLFKKFLSSSIKSQIEAGYMDECGKLTEEGKLTLIQEFYAQDSSLTQEGVGSALLTARANDLIARRKEEKAAK